MTNSLFIFGLLSIVGYIIVFLRVFFPQIIRRKFNKDKFNLEKLPANINKEEFLEKIKKLNRKETKELFFKSIGKTEKEILYDKISTYFKNILKFFPIFYFFIYDIYVFFVYSYSLFFCFSLVKILKKITKKERPDGVNKKSFPSGHCANASVGFFFSLNLFNFREIITIYKINIYYNIILSIVLFILWLFVIISRIKFKRHYFIDVIVGILIGVFSAIFVSIFTNFLIKIIS